MLALDHIMKIIESYSDFNNSFNGRHIYINKKKYLLATLWCSVAAATEHHRSTAAAHLVRAQILVRLAHTLRLKLSRAPSKILCYIEVYSTSVFKHDITAMYTTQ